MTRLRKGNNGCILEVSFHEKSHVISSHFSVIPTSTYLLIMDFILGIFWQKSSREMDALSLKNFSPRGRLVLKDAWSKEPVILEICFSSHARGPDNNCRHCHFAKGAILGT